MGTRLVHALTAFYYLCVSCSDPDQGQRYCPCGRCGLLPHSQPNLVYREGGECLQLDAPACPDHREERPWDEEA